jgi:hypothetical protein
MILMRDIFNFRQRRGVRGTKRTLKIKVKSGARLTYVFPSLFPPTTHNRYTPGGKEKKRQLVVNLR